MGEKFVGVESQRGGLISNGQFVRESPYVLRIEYGFLPR